MIRRLVLAPSLVEFSGVTSSYNPLYLLTDPFKNGLEACWNFNEASGTFYDSTGNHNLTITNNVNYQQSGKVSYSAGFLSSDSYARGDTGLNLLTLSISTWIKTTASIAIGASIFDKMGYYIDGNSGVRLEMLSGRIAFWTMSGSTQSAQYSQYAYNNGNWHHIVVTYDYATTVSNMWIDNVINGGASGSPHTHPIIPNYGDGNTPITLGNKTAYDVESGYFNGYIDATAVWSRVLDSAEVSFLWNAGDGLTCA